MRDLTDIQTIRKAKKLSQQDAARVIKCTRERISAIEQGTGKASIQEMEDLAAAYGCKIIIVNQSIYAKINQILSILGENCENLAE